MPLYEWWNTSRESVVLADPVEDQNERFYINIGYFGSRRLPPTEAQLQKIVIFVKSPT